MSLVAAAALLAGVAGTTLSAGVARADGGASSSATAPAPAAGERAGRHGGPGHHRHHDLLQAALRLPDLTEAQRGQIHTLEQSKRAPHVAARQAHEALAQAVAAQVDADKVDRNQLKPQLQAVITGEAAVEAANASALAGLHGVLTPAQRTELVDTVSAKMAEREQKRDAHQAQRSADAAAKTGPEHGGGMWGRALGLSPAQEAQIRANLKAAGVTRPAGGRGAFEAQTQQVLNDFKQATFTAPVATNPGGTGRMVDMAQAALPVLTSAQRTELATLLRGRGNQEDGN